MTVAHARPWALHEKEFTQFDAADACRQRILASGKEAKVRRRPSGKFSVKYRDKPEEPAPNRKAAKSRPTKSK